MTMHLSHAAVIDAQGGARPPGPRGAARGRRRLAASLGRAPRALGDAALEDAGQLAAVSRAEARDLAVRYPEVQRVSRRERRGPRALHRRAADRRTPTPSRCASSWWPATSSARACRSRSAPWRGRTRCRLRVVGRRRPRARCARLAADVGGARPHRAARHRAPTSSASSPTPTSCSRARCTSPSGSRVVEGAAAGCAVVCTDDRRRPRARGRRRRRRRRAASSCRSTSSRIAGALEALDADRAMCRAMGAVAATSRAPGSAGTRWPRGTLARYDELRDASAVRVLHVGLETTAARPGGLNRYLEHLVAAERGAGLDATRVVLGEAPISGAVTAGDPVRAAAPGGACRLEALAIARAVRRLARAGRRGPALRRDRGRSRRLVGVAAPRARRSCTSRARGPTSRAHRGAGRANVAVKRGDRAARVPPRGPLRRALRGVRRRPRASATASRPGRSRCSRRASTSSASRPATAPRRARALWARPEGRVVLAVRRLVPADGARGAARGVGGDVAPADGDLLAIVGDGPIAPASCAALAASLGVDGRGPARAGASTTTSWSRGTGPRT